MDNVTSTTKLTEDLRTMYNSYKDIEAALWKKSTPPEELVQQIKECISTIEGLLHTNNSGNFSVTDTLQTLKIQLNEQVYLLEKGIHTKKAKQQSTSKEHKPDNILEIIKNCQLDVTGKGFSKIAGLDKVKTALINMIIIPITQPQLYDGFHLSNCVLFYGPPGTGKTKLATAAAAEANAVLLSVSSSYICSRYVGESEKIIRNLFNFVKSSTTATVLFIDEIDGLCRKRTSDEADHTRRLKTEIMCQMTEFTKCKNGFLICATNCPWELDTAFKRRFERQLYVPLPNYNERLQLLEMYTKNTSLEDNKRIWPEIAERTDNFSGSDIERLVKQALLKPIERLQTTKVWTRLPNGLYRPASTYDGFRDMDSIFLENIQNLPPNSIQKVDAKLADLMEALDEVFPNVTAKEIDNFQSYTDKN